MRRNSASQSGLFNPRSLPALSLFSVGVIFGMLAAAPLSAMTGVAAWSLFPAPSTSATQDNYLFGVTCTSTASCWAVGFYNIGDPGRTTETLIELWNGALWSIVPSTNASGAQSNYLYDVTCTSVSDCWAVGYYRVSDLSGGGNILIEHWDGSSWTIVTPPDSNVTKGALFSVTCASTSDCWAMGSIIEHWNGTVWAITPDIDDTMRSNNFYSVTCTSASDCWAVGFYFASGADTNVHTLTEHWNGVRWSTVSSPDGDRVLNNFLFSTTCTSASDCWAVGSYRPGSGSTPAEQTLIEHWDGTSWTLVSSPNSSSTEVNRLSGLACASASECWATGFYLTDEGTANVKAHTLIEQWNGTSWSIVPSPDANGSRYSALDGGVVCASTSDCWAVGYHDVICPGCLAGAVGQTLIEHFAIPPPLNGVVSRQMHGSAGPFDITLPLTGTRGVECRSSTSLGAGNYTLVFSFASPLTSVGSVSASATGPIQPGPSTGSIDSNDPHDYIVDLTGLPNAQYITTTLTNVTDSLGEFSSALSTTMGVLIGDVNGDGFVLSGDYTTVRKNSGNNVDGTTFRYDINADGFILSGDYTTVRKQSGTQLPSTP